MLVRLASAATNGYRFARRQAAWAHVHVACSIRLQEAIQDHLMQCRLHISPVYKGTILCRVQAPQLLVLKLQACRHTSVMSVPASRCHIRCCVLL